LDFHDQTQLRRLAATSRLFETETLGEARATVDRINEANVPQIVESRGGFNIVNYKGKSWVINQSVGSVDFRDQEQLMRLAASGQLLEMETMGEARTVIDRMLEAKATS
jgi:hypothetical protein